MTTSLNDILSETTAPVPAAPAAEPTPPAAPEPKAAAEAPAAPAPSETPRGPDGKFLAKTEAPSAPPAAPAHPPEVPLTDREKAFQRAAMDERRKRQDLEQRLSQHQPPAPTQPADKPKTFWDDPDGALRTHEEKIQQQGTQLILATTERLARARYTDFDEKVAEFAELVRATPGLGQQWITSPDPAEFAYSTGKNHLMLKQAGSLEALTEKVRKETEAQVRAKVEAEYKAKQEELAKQRAALPPSLSEVPGGGAQSKPAWAGPTPLSDIISR